MKQLLITLVTVILFVGACSGPGETPYPTETTPDGTIQPSETPLVGEMQITLLYSETTRTEVEASRTPAPPTATMVKPTATRTIPPMPELSRNLRLEEQRMRGEDVSQLQEWLLELGYANVGSADSIFGAMTDEAVRQFQGDSGLTVDGVVGPMTWLALYQAVYNAPEATPTVKSFTTLPAFEQLVRGDSGKAVEELQLKLISLDYPICEQNDQFDLQTEAAVQLFQKSNDLATTGIVDAETWYLMKSMAAKEYEPPKVPVILPARQMGIENGAKGLAFDGDSLWFTANEQIIQFDPINMTFIKAIDLPYLGKKTGPDNLEHDVEFKPLYVFPPTSGEMIWLLGAYGYGYGPGTHAVMAINTGGDLAIPPVLFPGDFEYAGVQDTLRAGEEIWMFHQYAGEVTMYYLDYTGGLVPAAYLGYEFSNTSAYEYDGERLWALIALEGNALAPVEPYQASFGRGIGACGDDFSWDGSWLWVKRENVLFAYDKNGNLQAKAAAPDGYRIGEFAANEEYIAAAAFGKGSNTLLIFDK